MSLESRLRELEDRAAISELRARYCYLADARRWEELAGLFADDAEFYGFELIQGRAAVLEYLRSSEGLVDDFWHRTMNETLELDGDRARGSAYFDAPSVVRGIPMLCAGRYDDEFVKEPDDWRFAARRLHFFYFTPLSEGWRAGAVSPELARG